jgi:hypothetical protein
MMYGGFGKRGSGSIEPPIELRFVDLFMIILTAFMFITVVLSIISAFVGGANVDIAPRVLTKTVPKALANEPYELTLAAAGGSGSYTWEIVDGQLPEALSLHSKEGMIVGIPKRVQRTHVGIKLTDSQGRTDIARLEIEVDTKGEGSVATSSSMHVVAPAVFLPEAVGKQGYQVELKATGGISPYRWRLTQDQTLADFGLFLSDEGKLTGTPIKWGENTTFSVDVTDITGRSLTQSFRLFINAPPIPLWKKIFGWSFQILGFAFFAWFYWKGGTFPGFEAMLRRWLSRRRNR